MSYRVYPHSAIGTDQLKVTDGEMENPLMTWIVFNVTGLTKFDVYPFILLNLAFSLQAAYSAPLILLAQTRQAERDKLNSESDARHREELSDKTLTMLTKVLDRLDVL